MTAFSTSPSLLERLCSPADQDSWRYFVDLYGRLINAWLRRQGVNAQDAEDLSQEILTVVVRELPHFRHGGRPGAFRAWLRAITLNRLRPFWLQKQHERGQLGDAAPFLLDELIDPNGALSQQWDQEHDAHVLQQLLKRVEPEFRESHWLAFQRTALLGHETKEVATELGLTVNVVLLARSRVLHRLREEARGLVDF